MGNSPINRDHKIMATPHILTPLPESCIILFKCVSSPPIAPQTDKMHRILDVSFQALLQVCVWNLHPPSGQIRNHNSPLIT
jgi:hypothetical protein